MWSLQQPADISEGTHCKKKITILWMSSKNVWFWMSDNGIYCRLLLSGSLCLDDHVSLIKAPWYLSCICEINWTFSFHYHCLLFWTQQTYYYFFNHVKLSIWLCCLNVMTVLKCGLANDPMLYAIFFFFHFDWPQNASKCLLSYATVSV